MKDKIIGIDVDSVLADSDTVFTSELEKLTGRKLKRTADDPFKYEEAFGISDKEMERFWEDFTRRKGWLEIPPLKYGPETVKRLHEKYRIIVVSARPKTIRKQTAGWLRKNGIPYDELLLTDFSDKTETFNDLNSLEYFLEDNADFAMAFARKNIRVLLFDNPWNEGIVDKNITRVKDWKEVQKILFKSIRKR